MYYEFAGSGRPEVHIHLLIAFGGAHGNRRRHAWRPYQSAAQTGHRRWSFVRTVAVARPLMPAFVIRLSASRKSMSDAAQALCFMAGANCIFYGGKLLPTRNSKANAGLELRAKLQIEPVRSAAA